MQSEKQLQTYISKRGRALGLLVYKFVSPGHAGVPDLLVLRDDGCAMFIEVKSPTGKGRVSPLQHREMDRLMDHGLDVYVCDSKEKADAWLERFRRGSNLGGHSTV